MHVLIINNHYHPLAQIMGRLDDYIHLSVLDFTEDKELVLFQIKALNPGVIFYNGKGNKKNEITLIKGIHTEFVGLPFFRLGSADTVNHHSSDSISPEQIQETIDSLPVFFVKPTLSHQNGLENKESGGIRFNSTQGFIFVRAQEIMYIQADGNYSKIYFAPELYELVTQSLTTIEKRIPANIFLRLSRSFIINKRYFYGIDKKKKACILKSGYDKMMIPIPSDKIKQLFSVRL